MWGSNDSFDGLLRDIQTLKDFIRWPSIDHHNQPMKEWIEQVAGNLFLTMKSQEAKDDTRDILLALIEHLGLEYNHNKIVIQKKKGKR